MSNAINLFIHFYTYVSAIMFQSIFQMRDSVTNYAWYVIALHFFKVVVTVTNNLLKEDLSIHWHGIHMRQTPWMDGVAFVTQCPIPTKQTFQYRFIADPPGTHWYHSHLEMQKADGLFGAIIIHR